MWCRSSAGLFLIGFSLATALVVTSGNALPPRGIQAGVAGVVGLLLTLGLWQATLRAERRARAVGRAGTCRRGLPTLSQYGSPITCRR